MDCEIIRDLIPLYVDEVCSEKTKLEVKSHIIECKQCRRLVELGGDLQGLEDTPNERKKYQQIRPFKKIKKQIQFLTTLVIILALYIGVAILWVNPPQAIREAEGRYINSVIADDIKLSGMSEISLDEISKTALPETGLAATQVLFLKEFQKHYDTDKLYVQELNGVQGTVVNVSKEDVTEKVDNTGENWKYVQIEATSNIILTEQHLGLCKVYNCDLDWETGNLQVYVDYTWKWGNEGYDSVAAYEKFLESTSNEESVEAEADSIIFIVDPPMGGQSGISYGYMKSNEYYPVAEVK